MLFIKAAEANLYTFRLLYTARSIQICFCTLYLKRWWIWKIFNCVLVGLTFTDPSQFHNFMRKDDFDGKHYCTICEMFSHKGTTHVRNHIEAKHFPDSFVYKCNMCIEIFKNAKSLSNHRHRKHKDSRIWIFNVLYTLIWNLNMNMFDYNIY